jgi:hypothetical protein
MKVLSECLGLSRWLEDSAWAAVVALVLLTAGLLTYAGLRDWLAGGRHDPPGVTTPPRARHLPD